MDIEHLTYLLEMDRCRSLTHASECLYLSVQQLSRSLRAIEEEYQIKIFERTNLGLKPTAQGEQFIQETKKMLKQNENLHKMGYVNESDDLLSGTLSIYCSPNVWNKDKSWIGQFVSRYPHIRIDHSIQSATNILKKIRETPNAVGMYVYWRKDDLQEDMQALRDECDVYQLSEMPLAVYCSNHHPLAKKNRSVSLKDLADEEIVLYKPYREDEYYLQKIFLSINKKLPNIKYTVSDKNLIFTLLQETNCIFFASQIPSNKREDNLYCVPIKENIKAHHDLLIHKEHRDLPIVQAFCKVAVEYYDGLL